jgi:hypothetical protein
MGSTRVTPWAAILVVRIDKLSARYYQRHFLAARSYLQ